MQVFQLPTHQAKLPRWSAVSLDPLVCPQRNLSLVASSMIFCMSTGLFSQPPMWGAAASYAPPSLRMRKGELFDYLTEKVALSEKETR